MGGRQSRADADSADSAVLSALPWSLRASRYQRRVKQLADEVCTSPRDESLEVTLKRCIAFCYDVTVDWAPFVRVTVFADNVNEHQLNVPVYHSMLMCFGEPHDLREQVKCKAVPGTDVQDGLVKPSVFWTRKIPGRSLPFRALAHALLGFFVDLEDADPRKQLLVNILLQMHEACYNCVGRHKEVFEYCVYDLLDAERRPDGRPVPSDRQQAMALVRQHAEIFLDKHKRNALHAAYLSPLKYLFQDIYEIFENLDSHGASFWVAMLKTFFPDLDMPFEDIEQLDIGWAWGAIDFLPMTSHGSAKLALQRFSDPANLSLDWRTVTRDLPRNSPRFEGFGALGAPYLRRFRGLPFRPGPAGFQEALRRIRQQPAMQKAFLPYIERFTSFFQPSILLQRWTFFALSSDRWVGELGPALQRLRADPAPSAVAPEAVEALREELCSVDGEVNVDVALSLLGLAEVPWVPESVASLALGEAKRTR